MPKIPTFIPQTRASGNALRVPDMRGAPNLGRGLRRLGQSVLKADEQRQRRAELDEIGRLDVELSQLRVRTAENLKRAADGAQRGEDIVDPVRQSLEDEVSSLSETVTTAAGQRFLTKNGASVKETYVTAAIQAQRENAAAYAREDVSNGINNLSAELISNPNAFDSAVGQFEDSLAVRVENGTLASTEAAELKSDGKAALAESAVMGGIRENAPQALRQLIDGEWDEYLDGKSKIRLIQQAESQVQQAHAEARSRVQLFFQDTLASIRETGRDPGLIDEETIADAYPDDPERVKVMVDQIENEKEFYGTRQELAFTSPEEDGVIIEALTEEIPGANARQRAEQRDLYLRAVQEKRKALVDDPLGYVFSVSPELREEFQDAADNPQAFRDVLQKANELQGDLGVPEWRRSFLGKRTAETTVQQMNGLSAQEAANQIEAMAQQYGPMWPQAMRELREADLNPSYLTLARLDAPEDAVVRRDLAAALQVGRTDLRQNVGETTANDIDRAVEDELIEFGETLVYDGRAGQEIFNAESSSAKMLAYMYRRQGMDPNDAARKAANSLVNNRYDFVDTYRAPKGKGGTVDRRANNVLRELAPKDFAPEPGGHPDLDDEYRRRAAYLDAVQRGAWANTPQGDGIELLDSTGSPVVLESGERVQIMFSTLPEFETSGGAGFGFGHFEDPGVAQ